MKTSRSFFKQFKLLTGFKKPLEEEYQRDLFHKSKIVLRWAIVFSIFLFSAFAYLDVYLAQNEYAAMWVFRMIYCFYALLILAYSYTVFFEPLHQLVMGSLVNVANICLLAIMVIPMDNGNNSVYYTALILLMFFNFTLTNLRFLYALCLGSIIIVFYLFTSIYFVNMLEEGWLSANGTLFINNSFFLFMSFILGAFVNGIIETYKRKDFLGQKALEKEQLKSNQLLLNILPDEIAEKLKSNPGTIAEEYEKVSVLFADLVGFTKLASQQSPKELVDFLDTIFSRFDLLAEKYGLEKIKTIGDSYMVAGGLMGKSENHPQAIGDMALSMQREMDKYNRKHKTELQLRIGIHVGPVVAGVIGTKKFTYDLWGDSVNIASRMESSGEVGKIQVSKQMYEQMKNYFNLSPRGKIAIKGKGEMFTYFLNG